VSAAVEVRVRCLATSEVLINRWSFSTAHGSGVTLGFPRGSVKNFGGLATSPRDLGVG
jgi:hypothetical protein